MAWKRPKKTQNYGETDRKCIVGFGRGRARAHNTAEAGPPPCSRQAHLPGAFSTVFWSVCSPFWPILWHSRSFYALLGQVLAFWAILGDLTHASLSATARSHASKLVGTLLWEVQHTMHIVEYTPWRHVSVICGSNA